jgi:predicted Zn finger-like uncharacterized protein
MPIPVTCPECNATYRVADEAAGKAVKCKKCGARVPVPEAGEAEPAGATASSDDGGGSRPAKKQGGGSNKVVIIVASILVAFCCVCTVGGGGVGYYLYTTGKQAVEQGFKDLVKQDKIIIGGKDKGVVASGPTVLDKQDTLTTKDPAYNGKPAKAYKVKLEAGKEYIIDMKATGKGFTDDPYLFLLDATGKELAHDDDSGGGLNAQIRFTPPAAAEYTIQATCNIGIPPTGMPYHLTVKVK